jgi:hypothetical protein
MMKKKRLTSDLHARAPLCAAFVKALREEFGEDQVRVIYVKENDLEIGRRDERPV